MPSFDPSRFIPLASREPQPTNAHLDHARMMDCIHCGLCLPQCPTYAENGHEADSPRGRIYLMRALAEGRSTPTPDLVGHLDACLGCRACETACPSGVQYGHLLEGTRAYLRENYQRPRRQRLMGALVENTFPYPNRLELALLPVRLLRRWGVMAGLRKSGILKLLGVQDMEAMLPPLPPMRRRLKFAQKWQARGKRQARVGMITGCVMPVMQIGVNEATARVLCKAGCDVEAPRAQGCCGALHAHVGAMDEARRLAKRNIEAFEKWQQTHGDLDAIIINAAGCGSALKEYGGWFKDDMEWEARAQKFAAKVRDVSEWLGQTRFQERLVALMSDSSHKSAPEAMRDVARETPPNVAGANTLHAVNSSVEANEANKVAALNPDIYDTQQSPQTSQRSRLTYHDACHLCHGQGIRAQPRALLQTLPNVEIVPLEESEMCCGSAGIYNLTQPQMANQLLERKMRHIKATCAGTVVTGNPGCALQIRGGATKFGVDVKVKHPVELLDKATGA